MSVTAAEASAIAPRGGRLARNVAFLAGSQVTTWALTILWTVFVPRALGPYSMGQLVITISVTTLLSAVFSLGISTLMIKEIARDHSRAPHLVGTALMVRGALSLPCVILAAVYLRALGSDSHFAVVMALGVAAMVLYMLSSPFLDALRAMEKMQYTAYADVLTKGATAFLAIGLVFMGFRLVALMVVSTVLSAAVLVLSVAWSRRYFRVDWHFDWPLVRGIVIESLPYWATGLVLNIYMWIDSLMLAGMAPPVVVAWYGVPVKLFGTLLFVPVILSTAWLPRLARAFKAGPQQLADEARPALELVVIMSLPVMAGTALLAAPLINDLYGSLYANSAFVLVLLAFTLPPTYLNIMVNQVLVASNRQVAWTKVMIAATVLNPLLNLALIAYFQGRWHNGAIGAALSLLVTEIGMAGAGMLLLGGVMARVLTPGFCLRLLKAAAATAGMAAVIWFLPRHGLIVETAAGVVSFGVLALAFRLLTTREIAELRALGEPILKRLRRAPA